MPASAPATDAAPIANVAVHWIVVPLFATIDHHFTLATPTCVDHFAASFRGRDYIVVQSKKPRWPKQVVLTGRRLLRYSSLNDICRMHSRHLSSSRR